MTEPPERAMSAHLDPYRKPGFMGRLAERMRKDEQLMRRIASRSFAHPCTSTVVAVLGLPEPVTLPCVEQEGHGGPHRYAIEWWVGTDTGTAT